MCQYIFNLRIKQNKKKLGILFKINETHEKKRINQRISWWTIL